ncbi:hypothetical protein [Maricaulis maris]|uniref:hypothetical protein n=1 Tax=Maricaulis maris TaxID=74318 RepID=UPI003A914270
MSGGGGDSDNTVKDTPEQRHAAQVAAEKWNFAQSNLAPLEDQYMANVEDMDSAGRMSYIRGRANQASMDNLSQGLQQVGAQLGQAGINPNSGRWLGTQADFAEQNAQQGGETMGRAQFQQEAEQVKGLQNIVAMGSGESTQAQAGLSDIAATSAADARSDAANNFNRRSANLQLLGAAAGAASNYGMNKFGSGTPSAGTGPSVGLSGFDNGYGLSSGSVNGLSYGG